MLFVLAKKFDKLAKCIYIGPFIKWRKLYLYNINTDSAGQGGLINGEQLWNLLICL
jgi:hypothetical protein